MEAQREASADGRRYAVSSRHAAAPPLIVHDLASDAARESDKEPVAPVETIAFTADSSRLAVMTSVGEVFSYRFDANGTPRFERAVAHTTAKAMCAATSMRCAACVAPDARGDADCALQLIDLSTGALLWRIVLDTSLPGAWREKT